MTITEIEELLFNIKENTPLFVRRLEDVSCKGKYHFSLSGDIPRQGIRWGLGQSAFAARILYILGALSSDESCNIAEYINTFSHDDGSYYDEYIARATSIRRILLSIKYLNKDHLFNTLNKRAETRQAQAALINLGKKPKEYNGIDINQINVKDYFGRLDWCKPWASGSHINHLIFFINYSNELTEKRKCELLDQIEEQLEFILNKNSLLHEGGNLPFNQIIGGLMKILMGLSLVGREAGWVKEKYIDMCLEKSETADACVNFNNLYVLSVSSKHIDYRCDDIKQFMLNEVDRWMKNFYPEHNAFSFYERQAGSMYYGAKVTRGLDEPDMHGTAMYIWGLLLVSDALKLTDKLGFSHPVL